VKIFDQLSKNIIFALCYKIMSLQNTVLNNGEKGYAYRILVGKPEGNKPLGIPRSRWEDNIKMNL
jgi:hypothetical protein